MGNAPSAAVDSSAIDALRVAYPEFFPTCFETPITTEDFEYVRTYEDPARQQHMNELTELRYLKYFARDPKYYDLHEIHFQNFSLRLYRNLTVLQRRSFSRSDHAYRRVLRAAVYAIGSRDDIDWNGLPIDNEDDREKKRAELHQRWLQARLYDWTRSDAPLTQLEEKIRAKLATQRAVTPIWVTTDDTQTTVEKAERRHRGKRIAWLNMAHAHNTGGNYNIARGGGQEEDAGTNSDGIVILGLNSMHREGTSVREMINSGEHHIVYRDARHIPPGGNVFAPTRFVTSEPQIDCYMIATAFADFRAYVPFMVPYTERPYFFSRSGAPRNEDDLDIRCSLDIVGTIKTALWHDIDVLILGAGGCGAFQHDPAREARLWKQALSRFDSVFDEVVFAILPDPKRPNTFRDFVDTFTDRPPASFLANDDMESLPDYM